MRHFLQQKANLDTSEVRTETLDGIEYTVVPAIPLKEGVLNGVLYPKEEIRAFVESWNGSAIPVGHPTDANGNYISANSPDIIESQVIGTVFNTTADEDGTMHCEFWLNNEKTEALGHGDILEQIDNGEQIEISTGLWTDDILKAGVDRTRIKKYSNENNLKLNFKTNEFNGRTLRVNSNQL